MREALKRLAAQNLFRTQCGATGGAYVNKLSFEDAYGQQITTATETALTALAAHTLELAQEVAQSGKSRRP